MRLIAATSPMARRSRQLPAPAPLELPLPGLIWRRAVSGELLLLTSRRKGLGVPRGDDVCEPLVLLPPAEAVRRRGEARPAWAVR